MILGESCQLKLAKFQNSIIKLGIVGSRTLKLELLKKYIMLLCCCYYVLAHHSAALWITFDVIKPIKTMCEFYLDPCTKS